jgi:hypothetical protein
MSEWYIVSASFPKLALDIERKKKGPKGCHVIVSTFSGSQHQRWRIDGRQQSIICVATGLAVDIGSRHGPQKGSDIIMWQWTGDLNQQWVYDPATKEIFCPHYRLALDIAGARFTDGTNICAWTVNNKPQQQWTIYSCRSREILYHPLVSESSLQGIYDEEEESG